MQVNIEVIEKPEMATQAHFQLADFKSEKDIKEGLYIVFMISAEYSLDPELELADFKGYINQGIETGKARMTLFIAEDGLELDFS